ncbi:MAG: ATP-dependent sacrificial sulfur transferase LarE [Candidatus Omnitrophica bacterium]|nr:ATP-dependent sacrificial sulfur transferase LarE [Candidatus Omnitrophota bacterium]MBL7151237.1 ATP-dependent sacrificial sulfur transferase LarE [Candidatus Omnitrophota bacterium]MBL7210546.1 ATP-dependent sacrificial sulfur transferase LarE [Candidatus Omnitrophota bacterium]
MALQKKLTRLKKIISGMHSCLVAFSGGTDSSFLLKIASDILPKDKLLAVTADSATYPKEEFTFAKAMSRRLGVRHKIIRTDELRDRRFVSNPPDRCYFCKKELFGRLKKIAAQLNFNFVADASNISDASDFRPGNIAKERFKVRSPLAEAGLTKQEIRSLSKNLGLKTWDKPALACLASRIPYGRKISAQLLKRINRAEIIIKKMGFRQVRVRDYDNYCRIEVSKSDIARLITKSNQIVDRLKKLGYNCITLDLEGYRSGNMNTGLMR